MKVFTCPACGQLVFFHNSSCLRCGADFGFDPATLAMVAVTDPDRRCRNRSVAACNWLADAPGQLCRSCQLTRTRPADSDEQALVAFAKAERSKRRLVFQLLSLGLPLAPRDEAAGTGVAFDLLSSTDQPVTTGHAGGVITLDLAESDDVHRELVRQKLREPYRTLVGHFRHEIGHYYFPVLVDDDHLAEARSLFGDESADYQAALDRHYQQGPPDDWAQAHISPYATMHPSEDWAETFAHYLHLRGVLQTAGAYRLRVDGPELPQPTTIPLRADPAALDTSTMAAILDTWLPLSLALNAVSRSMGEEDLYPFVIPTAVVAKLDFIHRMVQRHARPAPPA